MSLQQIIETGQLEPTMPTVVLTDLVSMLAKQLDEMHNRLYEKSAEELSYVHYRQTLLSNALTMLNKRYGSDGMSLVNKGTSNFRILTVRGFELLLERVEEEVGWQVVITVFLTEQTRYDEWEDCPTILAACQFIEEYSTTDACAFLERADRWLQVEQNKRANPYVQQSLN